MNNIRQDFRRSFSEAAQQIIDTCTRPAAPAEYADWVVRHLDAGGKAFADERAVQLSFGYERQVFDKCVFTVTRDIDVLPSFLGAGALGLIVPKGLGVGYVPGNLGHNRLYFAGGDYTGPNNICPLYLDVLPDLVARGKTTLADFNITAKKSIGEQKNRELRDLLALLVETPAAGRAEAAHSFVASRQKRTGGRAVLKQH